MNNYLPVFFKILFCTVLLVGPDDGFSQDLASTLEISSINKKKQSAKSPLGDALKNIGIKHKVRFSFDRELVEDKFVEEAKIPESDLPEILESVLKPFELIYEKIDEEHYVIMPGHEKNRKIKKLKRKTLKHDKPWSSLKEGAFQSAPLSNRPKTAGVIKTITGQVRDENGQALPGTSVLEKGTTNGTITDAEGRYSLTVLDENAVLVFSFVGYITEEVPLGGRSVVDMGMVLDISSLQEVVVIGYGTVKKSDLTGSVASVSAEEIKALPIQSLDQALQGRAAGVQVTNTSPEPGGGVSIRIRGGNSLTGSNEPLYVIDGFPLVSDNRLANQGGTSRGADQPSNALAAINPNDIESIEILKDASATAIYGARGANGVVIITTKRGKEGKARIEFESYYGIQEVSNKIGLLNAAEYIAMAREGHINSGFSDPMTDAQADSLLSVGVDVDWQDEILRQSPIQNYQLSISGGSTTTKYAVTGNYFSQEGIVKGSGLERGSFRINLDQSVGDKLKLNSSLFASRSVNDRVPIGGIGGNQSGIIQNAWSMLPVLPVKDEAGNFNDLRDFNDFGFWTVTGRGSPVAVAERLVDRTTTNRIMGTFAAEYVLAEGLSFKTNLGGDLSDLTREIFWPNDLFFRVGVGGEARVNTTDYLSWINENYFSYSKDFNRDHGINFVAGFSQQSQTTTFKGILTRGFNTNVLEENGLAVGEDPQRPGSGKQKWQLNSWFGRINYNLKQKYLFTFTARGDGSSKFGEDNKWGFFPSGAVAWRVSEEGFLSGNELVSDLKLRASYGLTGNQEIGVQRSLALLGTTSYSFGDVNVVGVRESRKPNPDLKWETTTQFDIGVDVELWGGRINFTADYYRKETKDLLVNVPIALTNGNVTSILQNTGSVENNGMEFFLNSRILTGEVSWTLGGNLSFNRNKVLDPGPNGEFNSGRISASRRIDGTLVTAGEPIGSFFGWVFDGIWQEGEDIAGSAQPNAVPGDEKIRDINNDGAVDGNDRTIIGSPHPDFIYGVTSNLSYKGFELSVFLQGVQGGDILNGNLVLYGSNNWLVNQWKDTYDKRWTPDNPSNEAPRARRFTNSLANNSRLIEDGSFLRVKNITLAYNLPVSNWDLQWLSSLRVYFSANNVFTFTDYTGYDPEVNSYGQNPLIRNVDLYSYPVARSFLFGLNVSF